MAEPAEQQSPHALAAVAESSGKAVHMKAVDDWQC